jgi:signal transduction histidine kinase/integral membrane sensor domain MASE1
VLAEQGVAMPLPQLLAAFGCNVLVALLNAIALGRLLRESAGLRNVRDASLYMLVAVVVIPAIVAFAAGFEPTLGDGDPRLYWQFWWRWYLGNALGNLTLMPIFLTWFWNASPLSSQMPSRARLIEAFFLTMGLVISCTVAFDLPPAKAHADLFPALLYLPVPLLLAATVRFGGKGASGAILIITVMVLFRAMHGVEPFAGGPPGHSALSVQLFLAVLAVPAILLAALVEELQRTNERLSTMLDGISDGYCTIDGNGRIMALNAKGAAWCGHSEAGDLIGRDYWRVTAEQLPDPSWIQRALQTGSAARGEVTAPDGRSGELYAYPSPGGLSLFYHDISDRRAAELAHRATRELLQSSLNALTAQVAILDHTGKIIAINASWQKAAELLAQIGEHYLVGDNYIEECARARPHQRIVAAGLRGVMHGEINEFRGEYSSDIVSGRWIQLRGTRFGLGEQLRLVVACEDITEVKTAEASLRRLTGRLLRLQDEERRRISRELHDATAQNLLGATLGIGHALRLAPRLKPTARAALEESRALIEQSQREIRTVSYLLHPPMLDAAGLPAALRWLCDGFSKRTDIGVDLQIVSEIGRLPEDTEAALFRIAQEALANVHRHSGSVSVRVLLRLDASPEGSSTVVLSVEDDGRGMPLGLAEAMGSGERSCNVQNLGIGLVGMRERLHQLGGKLEIHSNAHGTTVRVAMPVPAAFDTASDTIFSAPE